MSEPKVPPRGERATSRLRMAGYAAILTALAFSQSAGVMVADTKFDLVTNPLKFLSGALHLWDPTAAFGQIQNQAYGYLWPMGPFFLLGNLMHVPEWAVQRLWWSLLLCLGFFGMVRLAQALRVGSAWAQVVAGFAFVLTPRITTLLGGTSVEVWPMVMAPWVLLPLVRGSRVGSVRRAAALSALAVATCGGVNAIAVAAVLPLGVIWLVTREPGARRWRLLGWWTLFTALASLWWAVPLLLLGRYSAPFLDYIENATITTVPTGLARTVVGTSDWVAYFAGIDYNAGQELVTTPTALGMAGAISAAGIVGLTMRGQHQRFLSLGLVAGLVLVGFGYSGDLAGFWSSDRTAWLDGALAPLRNLHKFDVVLRIPLVVGLAQLLTALPTLVRGRSGRWAVAMVRAATLLALAVLALPWVHDNIAPRNGVDRVPAYWTQAARYLASTDDGTVALVVPASAFGVYSWGNTHDDVMQGLAESPWAVRNVVPLAQPGNVVFLDAVTRTLESGRPTAGFARFLAENGVGRLVVRNDLDRFRAGGPDPGYVASVLDAAAGLRLASSFGPRVGDPALVQPRPAGRRVLNGAGLSRVVGSVEIYDVASAHTATLTAGVRAIAGDPGSTLTPTVDDATGGQPVLAEDAQTLPAGERPVGQVLTDDLRRRETAFAAVRWNESSTKGPDEAYELGGAEHDHRIVSDEDRWQTVKVWEGAVEAVRASSSQSSAAAVPPLLIGSHPGAALDGDPATAWRSARHRDPVGQFWQVYFRRLTDLRSISVTLARDSAPVDTLDLWAGGDRVRVPAPAPGQTRGYVTQLGSGRFLRVTASGSDSGLPGSVAISEVAAHQVAAQRYLKLPDPLPRTPVDLIALARDSDRLPCVMVGTAFPCNGGLAAPGEDGDQLSRQFRVSTTASYTLSGTVSLRRSVDGPPLAATGIVATTDGPAAYDVATGPTALVDGDPATTWVTNTPDETIGLTFPFPRRLHRIRVYVNPNVAASRPTLLRISDGPRTRTVAIDADGRGDLPPWTVSKLHVRVLAVDPAYEIAGTDFVQAPAGISSLTFGGRAERKLERLAAHQPRPFACGTGPLVALDSHSFVTAVVGTPADLMRGASVPLRLCSSDRVVLTPAELHRLVVLPSPFFRVDTLALRRQDAVHATTQPLDVVRDTRDRPVSVRVPMRSASTVLTLPQNVNAGWVATLGGKTLRATRVDGWKQGWVLPAGNAGTVRLSYAPQQSFVLALGVGAVGVLLCLAVVVVPMVRRRPAGPALPPLDATSPRTVDLLLVAAAAGLLAGWWGTLASGLALVGARVARRTFSPWPGIAGIAVLVGALGLSWSAITERAWAVTWTQGWTLAGIAAVLASLAVAAAGGPGPARAWVRRRRAARRERRQSPGSPRSRTRSLRRPSR